MKVALTESQIIKLLETIENNKITCDSCGWTWNVEDGGEDPLVCHKCGHENTSDSIIGKRVMVYYNLHKHTFSVTYKSKVILHADYVKLSDVEFRVRKGGKERVRQEKSKNVHAFVIGNLMDYCEYPCENIPQEPTDKVVTYNPYKYDTFVYKDSEEPVYNAKEVDMVNLKNKLFVINEIKSSIIKESDENPTLPTKYTYTTIGLYEKFGFKRYYFNDVLSVKDDDPTPNKIKIVGTDGDFIFDKEDIKLDMKNQKIIVDKLVFDKLYPNFELKKNKKLSETIGITSTTVRQALEKAFPDNWRAQTNVFTPGLRGLYTIGEKLGNDEDWSIMNYFDTKAEIHAIIYLKYFDDLKENPDKEITDIVDWMANLFANDSEFLQVLVDRQWSSIANGLKLEKQSVDNFINKIGGGNVTYYPHGSIMDRWKGVDVTVDGVNYQIKPLKYFTEKDGKYVVQTYGMNDYKSKKDVNKIAFTDGSKCLVFDNKQYSVVSKFTVVFDNPPLIID